MAVFGRIAISHVTSKQNRPTKVQPLYEITCMRILHNKVNGALIYSFQESVPILTKDGSAKLMRPDVIFDVYMCVKLVNELVS